MVTASAISRVLGTLGYRTAIRNGGVRVRQVGDRVNITVYPRYPNLVALKLEDKGYVTEVGHRSVIVSGKRST